MKDSDLKPIAKAMLQWVSFEEGGRGSVPPGPIFAATARFGELPMSPYVSILLRYQREALTTEREFTADIGFLAPELVADQLAPGVHFTVMEGPKRVADGVVVEVYDRQR